MSICFNFSVVDFYTFLQATVLILAEFLKVILKIKFYIYSKTSFNISFCTIF